VESLIVFAQQKIKLNLNSRLVVICVLVLAKPLGETAQQNRSACSVSNNSYQGLHCCC